MTDSEIRTLKYFLQKCNIEFVWRTLEDDNGNSVDTYTITVDGGYLTDDNEGERIMNVLNKLGVKFEVR